MISLLRYLRFSMLKGRFPEHADYINEGFGIEARALRARRFWRPHLALAKQFQTETLCGGEAVAILGAGRLLDVPLEFLASHFKTIALYDADPGCLASWRRFEGSARKKRAAVHSHVVELSGCISAWSAELDRRLAESAAAGSNLQTFLSQLRAPVEAHVPLGGFEAIVSLNLLSQIPLYWRERVLARLPELEHEVLHGSMAALQRQHLEALNSSCARTILILTDVEFNYYQRDKSPWLSEPALYGGIEVRLPAYREQRRSGWLWHIAPQNIEQRDHGVIHRVQALHFVRS